MHAIISADWHLRADRPRCRTDKDWIESQFAVVREIVSIANDKEVPLKIVGDIFHTPVVPMQLLERTIAELLQANYPVSILPGQHDEPFHSYDNLNKSAFGVLRHTFKEMTADEANLTYEGVPFGAEPRLQREILFIHRLVLPKPIPNVEGILAEDLLKLYPYAKWIFCGDYHHSFCVERRGRKVVNPGCIIRQAADMKDYQPIVFYVDTDKDVVEDIELKSDTGELVDDAYLEKEKERDDRIANFVDVVKGKTEVTLSFRDNLTRAAERPEVRPEVRAVVNEVTEELDQALARVK
jgi:DNA repair exonuclease SbcCD nuclease subunit